MLYHAVDLLETAIQTRGSDVMGSDVYIVSSSDG